MNVEATATWNTLFFVWRLHTGVWARNVTPPRLARYSSIQSLLRLSVGLAAAKTCTYVCTCMHMCVEDYRAPCGYHMLMCVVCYFGSHKHCLYMILSRHAATLLFVQALSALYKLLLVTTRGLMQPGPVFSTLPDRVQ